MPALRGCIKFLSDEIAALARDLVQTDDGVRNVVLEEFAAADREVAHARDAAANPIDSIEELMRAVDLEDGLEDGLEAGHGDDEPFDPEDDCEVHGCDGDCDEDCPCPCHAEPDEPEDDDDDDEEPGDDDDDDEQPGDMGASL